MKTLGRGPKPLQSCTGFEESKHLEVSNYGAFHELVTSIVTVVAVKVSDHRRFDGMEALYGFSNRWAEVFASPLAFLFLRERTLYSASLRLSAKARSIGMLPLKQID